MNLRPGEYTLTDSFTYARLAVSAEHVKKRARHLIVHAPGFNKRKHLPAAVAAAAAAAAAGDEIISGSRKLQALPGLKRKSETTIKFCLHN